MLKSVIVAGMVVLATVPAAWAAPRFSGAQCDGPRFEAYMLKSLGHGKNLFNGKASPNRFNYGPIYSASLVSNTGSSISCEISVGLDGQHGTHRIHGLFTATARGRGTEWTWKPAY